MGMKRASKIKKLTTLKDNTSKASHWCLAGSIKVNRIVVVAVHVDKYITYKGENNN